ncbi:hypothetical protein DPX16_1901 [Anabarilius grahami]|uniref:Uncharacterized protein n=1 Tax=Anabarilius grahami TaxID=495550 RepID=A0A3N0Z160_ANAGA|nr:hypothetical protein DPX16_1901 [Anabarilius grahami]
MAGRESGMAAMMGRDSGMAVMTGRDSEMDLQETTGIDKRLEVLCLFTAVRTEIKGGSADLEIKFMLQETLFLALGMGHNVNHRGRRNF